MSAGVQDEPADEPDDTLETWCPTDGEVTAELRGGTFTCPQCGLSIPRRILNHGPKPEDEPGQNP